MAVELRLRNEKNDKKKSTNAKMSKRTKNKREK